MFLFAAYLIDAGLQPSRVTFSTKENPDSKSGNNKEPYRLHAGKGRILSVASVTTPKEPSDPSTI